MSKKSDWTGGLTEEEMSGQGDNNLLSPSQPKKITPRRLVGSDTGHLSDDNAVKGAPFPPDNMRHGWHPKLN